MDFSTKKKLAGFYSGKVESLSSGILSLKKKNRMFVTLELLTFCLALAAAVFYCLEDYPLYLLVSSLVLFAAYAVVRRFDVINGRKIDSLSRLRRVYEKEIKYLDGDFSCFYDGSSYTDPQHPFTFDMDVYGHDSLFNRINRTVTTGGSDTLAAWLGSLLPGKAEVACRCAAIDELAEMHLWRAEFLAKGQNADNGDTAQARSIDSSAILKAVTDVGNMKIAPLSRRIWTVAAAYAAIACFACVIILSACGLVPASVAAVWGVVQMFVVIGLNARSIRNISRAVDKLHSNLHTYISLIRHIANAKFSSEELNGLQSDLTNGDNGAIASFAKLSDILDSLDRRGNFIGLILFNMFALSDYFLVRKFLKWQSLYMDSIGEWTKSVSRMDALVSMATFRFNEPKAVAAKIDDFDGVAYETRGLYHPFLGDKAVRNDFTVSDGNYYIITGANMAGKSTFLRSIGINYILALNGLPVFADALRVSVFNLFSSMRTTDDLSRGISYFNAELLRLKQLIDNCKKSRRTLIILDEILKGTNSLDKLNGSRLFLQSISGLPVSGIIATHDLELSKMEDSDPERFHNWCFEIGLADKITYTYKITPGVASNQNATFLLKGILEGSRAAYIS